MPNCGDLLVLSRFDVASGEVAAFEDQIGSHGGLGGWQSTAFVIHPKAWALEPGIVGSTELHRVLRAGRRGPEHRRRRPGRSALSKLRAALAGTVIVAVGVSIAIDVVFGLYPPCDRPGSVRSKPSAPIAGDRGPVSRPNCERATAWSGSVELFWTARRAKNALRR